MKIALVTETFYPAVDASTTTVKAVADRLIDAGHRVEIVAPGPGLGCYRGSRVARVAGHDRTGRQLRAALDAFAPDLVHVTSPGPVGRATLKHARRLGVPSVVVEQSPLLDVTADHWRVKVAERADTVLATSRWMVERLREFGADAELWQPGVDPVAFTPELRDPRLHAAWSRARSRSGTPVVVGHLGDLRTRRDARRLAELVGLPGTQVVVIGDGAQLGRLRSRLPDAVFTGPLDTGDLTVALASLDLVVQPGERETCCHGLRAAAASGVPVVAPRAGGAPDVVRNLETGLLHDPGRPRALANAVASLALDSRRDLMGRRGRELALERDWRTAVDELVAEHYAPLLPGRALRLASGVVRLASTA
ncbi:glycosyltransferase [Nocardioides sp.]|uniref:glycosyltransferase n=1 Tax=Nocardioides sp. TaxID=35761 RepID=UPI00356521AE